MIKVNHFVVNLSFDLPEFVSRTTEDSLYIAVERDMFKEEF